MGLGKRAKLKRLDALKMNFDYTVERKGEKLVFTFVITKGTDKTTHIIEVDLKDLVY